MNIHPDILLHIATFLSKVDISIAKNNITFDEIFHDYIIECGYLNLLKLIFANGHKKFDNTCLLAAGTGNLDILQLAHITKLNSNICSIAEQNGNITISNWMQSTGCKWNDLICIHAAMNGHLNIIKWAVVNGYNLHYIAYAAATKHKHQDVIQWMQGYLK